MTRVIFCILLLAGCAHSPARRAEGTLIVAATPSSARIYVDESFAGRAGELQRRPIRVAAGAVRVEVRAEGYFSAYREVDVAAGAQSSLAIELRAVPEGERGE